ncbi:hypothetical protein AVEN_239904-1 [Araneus ventricosus]|uniref:Uncharacterized protein n=1 Tax=Araneus ventricosus TaxID=182803 RepID=A0A4Y2S7F0_ARAVE|nr:hypothetical protein AVEN_239904-1 [Araneus ventricosus]
MCISPKEETCRATLSYSIVTQSRLSSPHYILYLEVRPWMERATRRPRETPVAPQTSLKHLRCAQQTTCLTGFPARWTSGRACEHQRCPRTSPLGTPGMPTQVQW